MTTKAFDRIVPDRRARLLDASKHEIDREQTTLFPTDASQILVREENMGSIEDPTENTPRDSTGDIPVVPESKSEQIWQKLCDGFHNDVDDLNRSSGDASFEQTFEFQCRISNAAAKTTAVVTADVTAQTITYSYEPEDERTAVPEKGILSLRAEDGSVQIFSADQQLTLEQARHLILEHLLVSQDAKTPDANKDAA